MTGDHRTAISAATLSRVEHAAGGLATRAVALMDEQLPWFRTLSAAHRSWVTLVAQAGISGYVDWLITGLNPTQRGAGRGLSLTDTVFGTAPRELLSAVSLRRTVELVRVAISVAEEHFPALAEDPAERAALSESLLRYSREVAFSAAAIYAAAAESRGRWDQRLEALVIDAIVRGERGDAVESRAAALSWDLARPALVLVGEPPEPGHGPPDPPLAPAHALSGVHGDRLIVLLAAPDEAALDRAVQAGLDRFGPGPVVRGSAGTGVDSAVRSARSALSGARAAPAWPEAPRPVAAAALLPERALLGDRDAVRELREQVYGPLQRAAGAVLETIEKYLASGRQLEPAARSLYVHPNTVRYRLHKVTELTGLDPWSPHDCFALQVALALGRMADGARRSEAGGDPAEDTA